MFVQRFACSWIGAFGLAATAFCQSYVAIVPPGANSYIVPRSINKAGAITGWFEDDVFVGAPIYEIYTRYGFVRDPGGTITTFNLLRPATAIALARPFLRPSTMGERLPATTILPPTVAVIADLCATRKGMSLLSTRQAASTRGL